MESVETSDPSAEDVSSSSSSKPAKSRSLPYVQKKKRTPAPPGAVSKGYLEYTGRLRARRRPRIPPSSFMLHGLPTELTGLDSSSSEDHRSPKTISDVTSLHDTIASSPEKLELIHSSSDLGVSDPESTSQPTRLHSLPPEIRIMIFKAVLRVKEVEQPVPAVDIPTVDRVYPKFVNLSQQKRDTKKDSVLNLLLVCRCFYFEAMPLFYELNVLRVSSPAMLCTFLNDLPRSRRCCIHHLRIGGIGFHYSGWQLMAKAISMLSLCNKLEHLELELAWEEESPHAYSLWRRALEEPFKVKHNPFSTAAQMIESIQRGTNCLKSLKGLKSIHFQMVGDNNPLLKDESQSFDLVALQQAVSSWAIKIRSAVISSGE